MEFGGIHHVTAVTANASANVAFYTQVLGMRLVKKTVNQDDVTAYHLFYADEHGSAGTDLTFFDWAFAGRHTPAGGMVSATALRVPGAQAVERWRERLQLFGVPVGEVEERGGRAFIRFVDPEGQSLEIVDDLVDGATAPVAPGEPWVAGPVEADYAIRGLDGVTLSLRSLAPTAAILTTLLGFRQVAEYDEAGHRAVTYEVGPGGPGAEIRLIERPDLPRRAMIGAGGVHHIALRAPDDAEHLAWRDRLAAVGIPITPVIDRFYFKSAYFREPGGVLFELATDGPGFAVDEDAAHLGESLALPPFLAPRRLEIEAGLKPIESIVLEPLASRLQ
ncbi:MAG TPA: ring-cleaving dioxygenase [Thermomicrobiales bacterium]|mgnify:CR=1 FL=1|nr:ring-cleaving dioxygenase [Chloroflexota bacterium]HQZ89174.1 ring-cleaving dioxygenase [Thermomicrobiales bacterium]HRA31092.1 ring-cleaving dioxygenase [Thermomicrobiales bacterium]